MKTIKKFDYKHNVAWKILRVIGEFTDGFEFISKLKTPITIFGSARFKVENKWYKEAEKLSRLLSRKGFDIITGGGPGIMEAANKGASYVKRKRASVGLNIMLPHEQRINPYVNRSIAFHYFFTRKVCMSFAAVAYVYFPGGFGTLDELFELVTLVQTGKIQKVPIVIVGKDFWLPLMNFIEKKMAKEYKTIYPREKNIIKLVDSAEEAYRYLMRELKKR